MLYYLDRAELKDSLVEEVGIISVMVDNGTQYLHLGKKMVLTLDRSSKIGATPGAISFK